VCEKILKKKDKNMKTIKNYYESNLVEDMLLKKNAINVCKRPSLTKIVLNIGVKEANLNNNKILTALLILILITGQQPVTTKAKRSVANFKLREGRIIGCKVTLRGRQMYNFLEKFIHIITPQLANEKKSFRYKNRKETNHISLGISDCTIFPELDNQYNLISNIHGMNIDISMRDFELSKKNLFFSGLKLKFQ
jgi:large subunit ribosomal protein L5